ncbi:hypothetical protein C3L33_12940, partial [Rhododendron williamsianum]
MAPITYDTEVTYSIPPAKLFKGFILDIDTLVPKVLPQAIKSVETLQGDGGAGTIKLITFGEAMTRMPKIHELYVYLEEIQITEHFSFSTANAVKYGHESFLIS